MFDSIAKVPFCIVVGAVLCKIKLSLGAYCLGVRGLFYMIHTLRGYIVDIFTQDKVLHSVARETEAVVSYTGLSQIAGFPRI
jgi:hypothetical protein